MQEQTWEPGLVVPHDEIDSDMLDEDDSESYDPNYHVVVRLFADFSYVMTEVENVRVLDPNKRPYIACVAADEQFVHRICQYSVGFLPSSVGPSY